MKNIKKQQLVLLSILILLLITYPFLSIADKAILVNGIPLLYLYLFIVWALAVILIKKKSN